MKKRRFIIISLLITSLGLMGNNPQKIDSKINEVKVYFNQAHVNKTTEFSLKQGNNEVILVGNSRFLNPESIQFLTSGDYMIMDFSPYMQYVEANKNPEDALPISTQTKLKKMRDTLEDLELKHFETNTYINILNKELAVVTNMKVISNPQTIDSLPKIKSGLDYYRTRVKEINSELYKKNKELTKLYKEVNDMKYKINLILQNELPQNKQRNEYFIRLNLYADKAIPKARLEYKYLVNNVNWQPIYDLKFYESTKPAEFVLKANLTQNTEEDWNDVKLVFSTETPYFGRNLGVLRPYYIGQEYQKVMSASPGMASKDMARMEESLDEIVATVGGISADTYTNSAYTKMTSTNQTMLGKQFEVGMKHSINSDGKSRTIPLETKTTKAIYKHYAIPKIEKAAYVSALISDWEDLELMDAKAKLYFENNYSNDIYISSSQTSDSLKLSIGQDRRVAIDRKVVRTKPEKANLTGSMHEREIEIEIEIRNNNSNEIELVLEDQIPISNKENIKVTTKDIDNATHDEKTGKLTWNLKLNPSEAKTIKFSYKVRYPKDENLMLN